MDRTAWIAADAKVQLTNIGARLGTSDLDGCRHKRVMYNAYILAAHPTVCRVMLGAY